MVYKIAGELSFVMWPKMVAGEACTGYTARLARGYKTVKSSLLKQLQQEERRTRMEREERIEEREIDEEEERKGEMEERGETTPV